MTVIYLLTILTFSRTQDKNSKNIEWFVQEYKWFVFTAKSFFILNVWATTMDFKHWKLWAGITTVSAVIIKTAWEVVFELKNCEGNEDNNNNYYYSFEKRIQNLPTIIRKMNMHMIPWLNIIVLHLKNFNLSCFFAYFRTISIMYKKQ